MILFLKLLLFLRLDQRGHVYFYFFQTKFNATTLQLHFYIFKKLKKISFKIFKSKAMQRSLLLHLSSLYNIIVLRVFLGSNMVFGRNISWCPQRAEVSGIKGGIKWNEWLCHIKVKDRCLWLQAVTATQDFAIINVLKPSEVLISPLNTAGDIWLSVYTSILYGCFATSSVCSTSYILSAFNHGYDTL